MKEIEAIKLACFSDWLRAVVEADGKWMRDSLCKGPDILALSMEN